MAKFIVIPNNIDNINNLMNKDCYILLGIEGYSVNTLNIDIDLLENLTDKHNNIFVSLNKNISNDEIDKVKELLVKLSNMNICGLFYYDVAIVNLNKKLDLNLNLVWSAEHLTTNYSTINYWYSHNVKNTFLSNEITKDEIIDISRNTDSKLIVQLFGYIPMYVSRRHATKNYLKHFNFEDNSDKYYLFKEDKKYSIVDNEIGTMIYSNFILNGLIETLELSDKVEYILINGYEISDDKLDFVIDKFLTIDNDNKDIYEKELMSKFDNLDKGFLYEETIYRVKRNDK